MVPDEREERADHAAGETDPSDPATAESAPSSRGTGEIDDRVDGVLELESDLSSVPGATARIDEAETIAQVTEVQRIDTGRVPDVSPVSIESTEAIAFRVRIDIDRQATIYLAWPDRYDEAADLAQLLAQLYLPPTRFDDILGEEIPLRVVGGQWIPDIPGRDITGPHGGPDHRRTATPHRTLTLDRQPTVTPKLS